MQDVTMAQARNETQASLLEIVDEAAAVRNLAIAAFNAGRYALSQGGLASDEPNRRAFCEAAFNVEERLNALVDTIDAHRQAP